MTERFAIYYAPARDSALWERAEAWLAQDGLLPQTVSARRYGFHATIKAPMALADGRDRAGLEMALAAFARQQAPVSMGRQAAELVADHLNGKTLPKHVVLDVHPITKSTVGKWAADCTY